MVKVPPDISSSVSLLSRAYAVTRKESRNTAILIEPYLLTEIGDFFLDLNEIHGLSVSNDRSNESLGRRHCNAQINKIVIHNLIVFDVSVSGGDFSQRKSARLCEGAHKTEF